MAEHAMAMPGSRLLRFATVRTELHARGQAGIAIGAGDRKQRSTTLLTETRPGIGHATALRARWATGRYLGRGLPRMRGITMSPAMMAARIIPLLTAMMTAGHPAQELFKESHNILREYQ